MNQEGKHAFSLGLAHVDLFNDFENHEESEIIPTFSYFYGRENKFFPIVDLHYFKQSLRQNYFSSYSINFSIGYNHFSFDSLFIAPFAGLGFYSPKANRTFNGVQKETESKIVFGVNLGIDVYLKLNDKYGTGFRYHYHNPFDSNQEEGGDLEGHYTTLSTYLSRSF